MLERAPLAVFEETGGSAVMCVDFHHPWFDADVRRPCPIGNRQARTERQGERRECVQPSADRS